MKEMWYGSALVQLWSHKEAGGAHHGSWSLALHLRSTGSAFSSYFYDFTMLMLSKGNRHRFHFLLLSITVTVHNFPVG